MSVWIDETLRTMEEKHPAIIGQPRFRSDMFSKFGWWKVTKSLDGEFFWPLMCNSILGAGDCEVCSGIPMLSDIMAAAIITYFDIGLES